MLPILQPVLNVTRPDGAFYLWPEVAGDDVEFTRALHAAAEPHDPPRQLHGARHRRPAIRAAAACASHWWPASTNASTAAERIRTLHHRTLTGPMNIATTRALIDAAFERRAGAAARRRRRRTCATAIED